MASAYPRIICSGLLLALLAVAYFLSISPADAELRYTTTYRENPIHGTTPTQLYSYMRAHPIIDEDGEALANITHDHKLSFETKRSKGVCRVDGLKFTWDFVITLPKAVDEPRMSSATRAMWRDFTRYLKRHEEHHRTIFIACGKEFVAEAAKLTRRGTCFGLKSKVRRFIDKKYDVCMKKQRAYDRKERRTVAGLALVRAGNR